MTYEHELSSNVVAVCCIVDSVHPHTSFQGGSACLLPLERQVIDAWSAAALAPSAEAVSLLSCVCSALPMGSFG